jgi:uncharacterized protein (DUF362 family)
MINNLLASIELCTDYPYEFPYSPDEQYPEYPFSDLSNCNPVYGAVRNHLRNLELDIEKFGTPYWNPFSEFDLIGKRIVIKPNWVIHEHLLNKDIWSVITHPSMIRVVLDYIYIATKGNCNVVIGDAPLQSADFDKIIKLSKINELIYYFHERGLNIIVEDFRLEKLILDKKRNIFKTVKINNNINKYIAINLFDKSLHYEIDYSYKKYRVTCYDKRRMLNHHKPGYHEYLISNTVIKSDFFINLPKMKTHRKAGVTLSLKNLIGINCSKDWLPHHRRGAKALSKSSDEYEKFSLLQSLGVYFNELGFMHKNVIIRRLLILISRVFSKIHKIFFDTLHQVYYTEGSWYGNDTIWRTCLDLNKIILYSDKNGNIHSSRNKRNFLIIIDGVIGGEKEAPLLPDPIKSGVTIAAFNPAVADFVATRAMGLDPNKIPIVRNSFVKNSLPIIDTVPDNILLKSSKECYNNLKATLLRTVKQYEPSSGWKGHIEYDK